MKTYYYNLDDGAFIYPSGDRCNVVPELFYQDQAVWRIALRDRRDRPVDISGITAWGAAVDNNYCSGSAPMCRTLSERITADVESGAVEVAIDAATPEFLAAVNGVSVKPAFFELYGLNVSGERVLSLCFEIRTRMTLDPDPTISGEVPEAVATKVYAAALVNGAAADIRGELQPQIDARPTSSGAAVIASGAATKAAQSATSGAIFSNTEIDTQIGGYRITATSGGVLVSGSGASVVLSGGQIKAGTSEGGSMSLDADGSVNIYTAGHNININADGGGVVNISGTDIPVSGYLTVNSRPVATQLVTSTSPETVPLIQELRGGMNYVYTEPLYSLEVGSVAKSTEASYIHFTLDSVTAPTPVVISGVSYLNSVTFGGDKEYLVGFFDGMAVVNEVTSGGVLQ